MVADALTMTGSIHDLPLVPECNLSRHLGSLLETGSLSDVTLVIEEKEYKAHKAILAGETWLVIQTLQTFSPHEVA